MSGIPILTYHSLNVAGNDYCGNDHVAFAEDLSLITSLGWRIISLAAVTQHLSDPNSIWPAKCVAISFDDGTNFDYEDLPHPTHGMQRGMLNIMKDFANANPAAQPGLHATSFVIASTAARDIMDKLCILGRGWMQDDWWRPAIATGLIHIGNHSWDHCHEAVPVIAQRAQLKGTFAGVDNLADADGQIKVAAEFIMLVAPNAGVDLFAYPYGVASDYLRHEYLPRQARDPQRTFVRAAFSTEPEPVTRTSSRWWIPRYVCGHHWKSPAELIALLREAEY